MNTNQKTIFLTGVTGNLGSRLMRELLRDPEARFKLLVRAENQEEAERSVRDAIAFWDDSAEYFRDRVEIFLGDITRSDLGLSSEATLRLSRETTHIIHCAANFRLDLPLEDARKSIVTGTEYLADFARHCMRASDSFRRFVYVSTEEIAIPLHGDVPEDFLPLRNENEYFNTYEYAKAEAETSLKRRMDEEGLPLTIVRPGMIVGDSQSGKILNPQGLYYMIRDLFLRPQTPVIPVNNRLQIDAVSVDAVAKSICVLFDAPEAIGRVYHISSGRENFVSLPEFLRLLQSIYRDISGKEQSIRPSLSPKLIYILFSIVLPFTWGLVRSQMNSQRNFLKFYFVDVNVATKNTRDFLASKGVTIPPLREYLPKIVRYYIEHDTPLAPL